jgi:hypothetical protein
VGIRAFLKQVQPGDLERLEQPDGALELFHRGNANTISLEKTWDGLHRLLVATGPQPELSFIYEGGTEVGLEGDDDETDGRPRLLDSASVKRLASALQHITADQLWAGFDANQIEQDDVYPGIWDEDEDELREEYTSMFEVLQDFMSRVAGSDGEVLIALM